jgi:hypothetical protein
MESMNKRCVFLEHVVSVIGSSNVQIVRGRAEVNQIHFFFNENFDFEYSMCLLKCKWAQDRVWGRIFASERNLT